MTRFLVQPFVAYATKSCTVCSAGGSWKASFRFSHALGPCFVLCHYVSVGVEELDQEKLTPLLRLKYHNSIADAVADLGNPEEIGKVLAGFQKYLYAAAD